MVALDNAGALQRPDPPQAGRCRNAGALRQLHIGHAAVGLQVAENSPVDTIELCPGHWFPPLAAVYARIMSWTQ
jgi:hypothetical protein